jgi:hypothetical protein
MADVTMSGAVLRLWGVDKRVVFVPTITLLHRISRQKCHAEMQNATQNTAVFMDYAWPL